jgi:hypothetical protein
MVFIKPKGAILIGRGYFFVGMQTWRIRAASIHARFEALGLPEQGAPNGPSSADARPALPAINSSALVRA